MGFRKCKQIAISAMLTFVVFYLAAFLASSQENDIYTAVINHEQRLQSDLEFDEKRNPVEILPFTQIVAGDKVLELGAGGRYTTELISWTVGSSGKVFAHFLYDQER
jgi:predicted methyltransferase